jgi:hyperosmotically inducible periplasmic protein
MDCPLISKAMLTVLFATSSTGVWSQSGQNGEVPADPAGAVFQTQIAKPDRRADRALKMSIYKALAKHTEIDAGNISIVAKNGLVTLDGTVTDADQIAEVERVVGSSPGVLAVTNKLMVQRPFEQ